MSNSALAARNFAVLPDSTSLQRIAFQYWLSAIRKFNLFIPHCNTLSAFQNAAPEAQADAAWILNKDIYMAIQIEKILCRLPLQRCQSGGMVQRTSLDFI